VLEPAGGGNVDTIGPAKAVQYAAIVEQEHGEEVITVHVLAELMPEVDAW